MPIPSRKSECCRIAGIGCTAGHRITRLHQVPHCLKVAALCCPYQSKGLPRIRIGPWQAGATGQEIVGDGSIVRSQRTAGLDRAEFARRTGAADHAIFALVQKYRGSISAEHGIGLLKKAYLGYSRTPEEIALMRGIKDLLDPLGLLNPGKVLDQP